MTCQGFGTKHLRKVFERIAPKGVVKSKGKRLVVCIIAAYRQNLSFNSPSSIEVSIAGATKNAVVTVIVPLGIHVRPTKIASLNQ